MQKAAPANTTSLAVISPLYLFHNIHSQALFTQISLLTGIYNNAALSPSTFQSVFVI